MQSVLPLQLRTPNPFVTLWDISVVIEQDHLTKLHFPMSLIVWFGWAFEQAMKTPVLISWDKVSFPDLIPDSLMQTVGSICGGPCGLQPPQGRPNLCSKMPAWALARDRRGHLRSEPLDGNCLYLFRNERLLFFHVRLSHQWRKWCLFLDSPLVIVLWWLPVIDSLCFTNTWDQIHAKGKTSKVEMLVCMCVLVFRFEVASPKRCSLQSVCWVEQLQQ